MTRLAEISKAELTSELAQIPRLPEFHVTIMAIEIGLTLSDCFPMEARYFRWMSPVKSCAISAPGFESSTPSQQLWIIPFYDPRNNWIHVGFACSLDLYDGCLLLDDEKNSFDFAAIFSDFAKKYPKIRTLFKNQLLHGHKFIMEKFIKWAKAGGMNYDYYSTYLFRLAEGAPEMLAKMSFIQLPDGFEFRQPNLHEDAVEIATKIYSYPMPQDEVIMRAKLEHLPSALVVEKSTNKLAGCYMTDPRGIITTQFTYPQHSGRGIGKAMELKLLKDCLSFGISTPVKTIEMHNERLIENHERSQIWCRWNDNAKRPIHYVYLLASSS